MIAGMGEFMSCSGVGSMMRSCAAWLVLVVACGVPAVAQDEAKLSKAQRTAVADVQERVGLIKDVNRKIWNYAEVGLAETRSSKLLQQHLKDNGFKVKNGVAAMPTAFVASYGSGKPVIGILAEYDALPGMSQKVESVRAPLKPGQPGHACGHSGLGSGALGAALAVKTAMDRHKIKGTIRLYGTPAEETVIGKVYSTSICTFTPRLATGRGRGRPRPWSASSSPSMEPQHTPRGIPKVVAVRWTPSS